MASPLINNDRWGVNYRFVNDPGRLVMNDRSNGRRRRKSADMSIMIPMVKMVMIVLAWRSLRKGMMNHRSFMVSRNDFFNLNRLLLKRNLFFLLMMSGLGRR
jgi:hypothetical protein